MDVSRIKIATIGLEYADFPLVHVFTVELSGVGSGCDVFGGLSCKKNEVQ